MASNNLFTAPTLESKSVIHSLHSIDSRLLGHANGSGTLVSEVVGAVQQCPALRRDKMSGEADSADEKTTLQVIQI